MIGKLTGVIDHVSENKIILDVSGVGYVVVCSVNTLRNIGKAGEKASLLIETIVREDSITLFGFASLSEQEWFKLLTTVQGVGPKAAMSILSAVSPERISEAIAKEEKSVLTSADGVGAKLALRIITELKDKVPAFAVSSKSSSGSGFSAGGNIASEAVSALCNLGYRRADVFSVISGIVSSNKDVSLQDLIRLSLKELAL